MISFGIIFLSFLCYIYVILLYMWPVKGKRAWSKNNANAVEYNNADINALVVNLSVKPILINSDTRDFDTVKLSDYDAASKLSLDFTPRVYTRQLWRRQNFKYHIRRQEILQLWCCYYNLF